MLHIILIILNIVSLFVLSMLVFEWPGMIPCGYSEQVVDKINDIAKDLAIAVITSTFFYYLVFFLIERRRNKKIREINQGKLQLLFDIMQKVIAYYVWKLDIPCEEVTMMHIEAKRLIDAPIPEKRVIARLRVKQPAHCTGVALYDGNQEVSWLNHFASETSRFSKQLIDDPVFCMDDIDMVQIVKEITSARFISDVGIINSNTIAVVPAGYGTDLKSFYELYRKLGKYVKPQSIILNDNLPVTTEIPIIYQS